MKTRILAVAAMLLVANVANAQGRRPTPTPTPTPGGSPWTDPSATTTPAAATSTTATSTMAANTAPADGGGIEYRPTGKSIGVGAGFSTVTSVNISITDFGTPDVVSARFRMDSGLTIEPAVQVAIETGSSKVGTAAADTSTGFDMVFGGNIRKPIWSRMQAEAIVILGGTLSVGSDSTKVAGAKSSSTAFGIGANYGVGVEWFPRRHWSISADATNPIIDFSSSQAKDGAGVKTTNTDIFIGAVFDPTVRLMTHLYY